MATEDDNKMQELIDEYINFYSCKSPFSSLLNIASILRNVKSSQDLSEFVEKLKNDVNIKILSFIKIRRFVLIHFIFFS